MSAMSNFYEKVLADEAVKKQITDILGETPIENAGDAELEKIGEIAKGMGFSISVEEAREYFRTNEEELSDESLEVVAGGGGLSFGRKVACNFAADYSSIVSEVYDDCAQNAGYKG